ncbi:MAG TPA: response regulator [Rhodothermales bacterium]|nr:response regulator [Rhodothermales bacterium]
MNTTILLIDDDHLFVDTVRFVLEQEEYDVLEAHTGPEGLEMAREHRPSLILCDVRMRDGNGYATVQTLRQRPMTASIPVIMMTGHANPYGERRSRLSGADFYLAKPFSVTDLITTVRRALSTTHDVMRSHDVIFPSPIMN